MGLDMSYQAIPADSEFFIKTRESERTTTLLNVHGFKDIPEDVVKRYSEDSEFTEFKKESDKIRRSHTNIENREFYFGRRWDMLHYLLSEIRRDPQKSYDESDLIYRAIHGGEELGGNAVLPQGIPVRYLTPQEVKEVSKLFGQIKTEELEKHWDPPQMREAGVYKIRGDYSDEIQLIYLREEFEKLKDFYLWAAIYDEAVLVFCD